LIGTSVIPLRSEREQVARDRGERGDPIGAWEYREPGWGRAFRSAIHARGIAGGWRGPGIGRSVLPAHVAPRVLRAHVAAPCVLEARAPRVLEGRSNGFRRGRAARRENAEDAKTS